MTRRNTTFAYLKVTDIAVYATAVHALTQALEAFDEAHDDEFVVVHFCNVPSTRFVGTELVADTPPRGLAYVNVERTLWTLGLKVGELRHNMVGCIAKLAPIIAHRAREHKVLAGSVFLVAGRALGEKNLHTAKAALFRGSSVVQLKKNVKVFVNEVTRETCDGVVLVSVDLETVSVCVEKPRIGQGAFLLASPPFDFLPNRRAEVSELGEKFREQLNDIWTRACRARCALKEGLERLKRRSHLADGASEAAEEAAWKPFNELLVDLAESNFFVAGDSHELAAIMDCQEPAAPRVRRLCAEPVPIPKLTEDDALLVTGRYDFMAVWTRDGGVVADARVVSRLRDGVIHLAARGRFPELARRIGKETVFVERTGTSYPVLLRWFVNMGEAVTLDVVSDWLETSEVKCMLTDITNAALSRWEARFELRAQGLKARCAQLQLNLDNLKQKATSHAQARFKTLFVDFTKREAAIKAVHAAAEEKSTAQLAAERAALGAAMAAVRERDETIATLKAKLSTLELGSQSAAWPLAKPLDVPEAVRVPPRRRNAEAFATAAIRATNKAHLEVPMPPAAPPLAERAVVEMLDAEAQAIGARLARPGPGANENVPDAVGAGGSTTSSFPPSDENRCNSHWLASPLSEELAGELGYPEFCRVETPSGIVHYGQLLKSTGKPKEVLKATWNKYYASKGTKPVGE